MQQRQKSWEYVKAVMFRLSSCRTVSGAISQDMKTIKHHLKHLNHEHQLWYEIPILLLPNNFSNISGSCCISVILNPCLPGTVDLMSDIKQTLHRGHNNFINFQQPTLTKIQFPSASQLRFMNIVEQLYFTDLHNLGNFKTLNNFITKLSGCE